MKKIMFFTENIWAFGSIHNALCKMLYRYGVLAEIIDSRVQYSVDDMKRITRNCNYIICPPCAVSLLAKDYEVSPHKIIMVSHGQSELLLCLERLGKDIFNHVHDFAVVSDILKQKAQEFGIPRIPKVLTIGVHYERYAKIPPLSLRSVGYAGILETNNYFGEEIKRGRLVMKACENAGLKFVGNGKNHYMAMPTFYEFVDCVVMSSTEESVGLPMLEAACSGRLTIGTPVGYHAKNRNGVVVPIPEENFVNALTETLLYYKNNPDVFHKKCIEVQEFAKSHFDWEQNIQTWGDLLKS